MAQNAQSDNLPEFLDSASKIGPEVTTSEAFRCPKLRKCPYDFGKDQLEYPSSSKVGEEGLVLKASSDDLFFAVKIVCSSYLMPVYCI